MNDHIAELLGNIAGSGGMRANIIQFDSEGAGIEHAKRLAALKPGDIIYSGMEGEKIQKFVFMGHADAGGRALGICVETVTLSPRDSPGAACASSPMPEWSSGGISFTQLRRVPGRE